MCCNYRAQGIKIVTHVFVVFVNSHGLMVFMPLSENARWTNLAWRRISNVFTGIFLHAQRDGRKDVTEKRTSARKPRDLICRPAGAPNNTGDRLRRTVGEKRALKYILHCPCTHLPERRCGTATAVYVHLRGYLCTPEANALRLAETVLYRGLRVSTNTRWQT